MYFILCLIHCQCVYYNYVQFYAITLPKCNSPVFVKNKELLRAIITFDSILNVY